MCKLFGKVIFLDLLYQVHKAIFEIALENNFDFFG